METSKSSPRSNTIAHSTLSISSCTTNKGNQGIQQSFRLYTIEELKWDILILQGSGKGEA
jgi:hypothetical protein